jgi:hypothetical protein
VNLPANDHRPLFVLTLDGLLPHALGCYGSSWNETPAIDAIAASGCLWDRCIACSDDPRAVLASWWCDGAHKHSGAEVTPWVSAFSDQGALECVTDDAALSRSDEATLFDTCCLVQREADPPVGPAESLEQTRLAQLMAAALDRMTQPDPIGLLWVHSNFLTTRWDAPRNAFHLPESVADEYAAEGPETYDFGTDFERTASESIPFFFDEVTPPRFVMSETTHPDVPISWMRTYAFQIRLVDELLGLLFQSLDGPHPHVMLAGTSGFSLGQSGVIGHRVGPLRSCDIRLPLIIRRSSPRPIGPAVRVPHLISSGDVTQVLARLNQPRAPVVQAGPWGSDPEEFSPLLFTESRRCRTAVTTPRWFMVRDRGPTDGRTETSGDGRHLFVKPDDVHDMNDVRSLRGDVIERLETLASQRSATSDRDDRDDDETMSRRGIDRR